MSEHTFTNNYTDTGYFEIGLEITPDLDPKHKAAFLAWLDEQSISFSAEDELECVIETTLYKVVVSDNDKHETDNEIDGWNE